MVSCPARFTSGTNQNYVIDYAWNAASQRTSMTLTVRTQSALVWSYTYTDDGLLETVTNPDSDVTTHEYLTDGRLKTILLENGALRSYYYQDTDASHAYVANKNTHLRKVEDTFEDNDPPTVITSFEYELDATGNRLSMTDKDGNYSAYAYDPLQQLKAETRWTAKTAGSRSYQNGYVLDPNGNRQTEYHNGAKTAYTVGDNNELLTAGSLLFTYDRFGNTATREDTSIGEIWTFGWDYESHLLSITSDGTQGADTHEYDGDSHRMRSKFNAATDWTNYVYDELEGSYPALLAEYTLVSSTFTMTAVNTWGLGLISIKRGGTVRYFHFDGLGSTWALTNIASSVSDTYSYSAYGELLVFTGTSTNVFQFCGRFGYVADSVQQSPYGYHYLEHRYLATRSGTFLSPDPIGLNTPYLYVRYSVTRAVDPKGLIQSLVNPRPSPFSGPPPIWSPCSTCECWNEVVYRFCLSCEHLTGTAKYDCRRTCSALADWYYRACKGPRGGLPNQEWQPSGLPFWNGGNVIPIWPPISSGGGGGSDRIDQLEDCLRKAKSQWEATLCWAKYIGRTIIENY